MFKYTHAKSTYYINIASIAFVETYIENNNPLDTEHIHTIYVVNIVFALFDNVLQFKFNSRTGMEQLLNHITSTVEIL